MIEFINQNSGFITIIFTGVVALSTVVYAILTAILVTETKRIRLVQTEPKIEIVIDSIEGAIWLIRVCVRNIGFGPAFDISINIAAESGGLGAEKLINDFTESNFFKTGLKYLGPGQVKFSSISSMVQNYEQKIESVLVFNVSYRGATGLKFQEKYRIDFAEFKGDVHPDPPLCEIAKHLKEIQRDFNHLVIGFRRIKIDIYNNEDREKEQKELEKLARQNIEEGKEPING